MLKLDRAADGSWHLLAKDGTQLVMSFVSRGDALEYVRDLKSRWDVDVVVSDSILSDSPAPAE